MQIHTLRREQRLPGAPAAVFGFFSDARNLEAITPPLLRFRVLTPEPAMGAGALIRYGLRIHGVPLSWLTQITEWEPPYRFVDEQLDGPYALWRHTHSFEAAGEETIMRDVVRYRIGFGPLGTLAHALVVRRDLDRIFDYRAERVPELLGAAEP
jgi:hypothetical protein